MADIFISYTHSDQSAAEALAKALAKHGWSIFWDRTIPIGKTWDQVLESELNAARTIVVLWSSASVSSEWVRVEAEEGVSRNILIPVLLEDYITIPLRFRALQAARLVDWRENLEGGASFEPLTRAIQGLTGAPSRAPLVKPSAASHGSDDRSELRDIYLGYGTWSSGPATRIKQYLVESEVTVLDWVTDFRPGATILEEVWQAAKRCKRAIFLFTKDDSLVGRMHPTVQGNLAFELGFFVHAVGPDQVLIILEEGMTLPADVAGMTLLQLDDVSNISITGHPMRSIKTWLDRQR